MVDEYKRAQLPVNYERKREWTTQKLEKEVAKEQAKRQGVDYERSRFLDTQADQAERWDRKQRDKHNPDHGFASYEESTARQHTRCGCLCKHQRRCVVDHSVAPESSAIVRQKANPKPFLDFLFSTADRMVKQIKPDFEQYERTKERLGEQAFYAGKDTVVHGLQRDTKESIDRMVDDLNAQVEKRHKFSRRRRFDDDADIDYINEKNMRFNKNLERFYGKYTAEIKQNLERGTAV